MKAALLAILLALPVHAGRIHADPVGDAVESHLEGWLATYRELHAAPELSLAESATAARVAAALEAGGYAVTRNVGGHGVVAVLENGSGPTLLLRGDTDALPIVEETGLPYTSHVRATREDGTSVGVMHACGHDVHTTNLMATAGLMAEFRALWSGTLLVIAQPAEELGQGARAMIADGLFERFPVPDYTLALHVTPDLPAGDVGLVSGWAMANVDAVDITIRGRGGHGARPHNAVDPIVTAAHVITALQTIVSRRVHPIEPAVVTVGSIHGGTKHNIIPDEVHLQLTVRSYSDETRDLLLSSIRQIATDQCAVFACPQPPIVEVKDEYTPSVYNHPDLTARARAVFEDTLGAERVHTLEPSMGGEDFGRYARTLEVPGLLFRVGATPRALWKAAEGDKGVAIPSLHSSRFAPEPEATLRTAATAMTALALEILRPAP